MTVVCKNEHGWLVDHWRAVRSLYRDAAVPSARGADTDTDYCLKRELFEINLPFLMNSQVEKYVQETAQSRELAECEGTEGTTQITRNSKKRKKRRRQSELNEGEILALERHAKIKSKILDAYSSLLAKASGMNYFRTEKIDVRGGNNLKAQSSAQDIGPADKLTEMCDRAQCDMCVQKKSIGTGDVFLPHNPANTIWHYNGNSPQIIRVLNDDYVLPPRCTFLMSDFAQLLDCDKKILGKFDLIMMDPPWENKSVKRKKKYIWMDNAALLRLPVSVLANKNCLVVVWVTNRHRHLNFVMETLFPAWSVRYVTEWYWLKVTRYGQMVYEFDSPHKKPYETMILGRFTGNQTHSEPDCVPQQRESEPNCVPHQRVIISVPCSIHSKKPPLFEVLQPFLPEDSQCLELFARNLWPGWTSWGNEVLKHQHLDFYECCHSEEKVKHVTAAPEDKAHEPP